MMDGNILLTDDKIRNYFATINPIASKIQNDIDIIKSKYSREWNNLSLNDQINIINEAILNSEISLKYFDYYSSSTTSRSITPILTSKLQNGQNGNCGSNGGMEHQISNVKSTYNYNGKDLSTYCKMKTGRKFLHDDTFGGFRDEHSAPFSFKSKSQVNLNIFPVNEVGNQKLTNICESSLSNNNRTEHQFKSYNPAKATIAHSQNDESTNKNLNTVLSATNLMKHNNVTNGIGGTNNAQTGGGDVIHSNFFSKFILKSNNIIFDGMAGSNNDDEEVLVNFERISSSSMPSEEEIDERNIEIKSLLKNNELRKDYDFLANW